MLHWVFFDVGNVLLDEDPLTYRNFCLHVAAIRRVRPDLTFDHLLAEREAAAAGMRWPLWEVVRRYLDEPESSAVWEEAAHAIRADFAALSPAIPGAAAVLDRLSTRFRLGVVANQGAECRERLTALGWLDRFAIVLLAEEQGLAKPDPALFQRALERSGAAPGGCLMVGDRLDNDVAPAAALGMATAWVRWPRRAAKGWPDAGDRDAMAYLAALERTASCGPAGAPRPAPTFVIDTIDGLVTALERTPRT